ncbi:MAG: HEPN domain-containing protein [Endomicrobium sp.]|jgi:HEPN domain-containing protein|nr:HEPN domain-containing protein [Endomicrobium sp.]
MPGFALFLCQQAIEKYFKAFLIENGWELKKIHDLELLYKEIQKIKKLKLDIDILDEINDIYFVTRYPNTDFQITYEDAREFYNFALKVAEIIKGELM